MRITIGTKLILGFMLVVLLMIILALFLVRESQKSLQQSVGKSSIFLAEEMLKGMNHDVYLKIVELETHSKNMLLQKILSESNRKFEKLDNVETYINQQDKKWVAALKDEITPFMQGVISNELSNSLREEFISFYEAKYGYMVFGEVFITNKYGANIAQTRKTSDYRQDDEQWWQFAKEEGFYVSDVAYDESAGMHGLSVGVRVNDSRGNFIGVIKAVLALEGIIREAGVTTGKYETTVMQLITKDGNLIYATKVFKLFEDVSERKFFSQIKGQSGFFIVEEGGKEKLFSYAHSRGYKNFEGLGWILVVGHDVNEILHPAFTLRNRMLVASLLLIAMGIVFAFVMSRSIIKPITLVQDAATKIAQGELDKRIEITSRDEIGQLAHTFNNMAGKLKKSYRGLEKKVHERTKDLEKANKELKREITAKKLAEEELKTLNERLNLRTLDLERSNKELEQFAYVASHDLQEPLRMVSSYTQLLAKRYKDKLDKDAHEFIDFAVDGANRMQRLIQDLLSYSRVGTQKKPIKASDCNAILGRVRADLNVVIEENNAVVTNDELPTVMADETQLVQVFQNLIVNAIKFRDKDPPSIHVSAEQNRNEWILSVSDNGIGIDPEFHERIFVIFQRLLGKAEDTGTGIGLALCKRIVESHGGRIWVESQPGKGSTFYFTIPRKGGKQS